MLGVIKGSMEIPLPGIHSVNRHGDKGNILPHQIGYQELIEGMVKKGVTRIVAIHTVGGISETMTAGTVCVPSDVIDYTTGREQPYTKQDKHVDCSELFSKRMREQILRASPQVPLFVRASGVLAVTNGPRLETPSEVTRMEKDGASLVGMTAMPEAVVAKLLGVEYVSLCVVVNRAAGRAKAGELTHESMKAVRDSVAEKLAKLIYMLVGGLPDTICYN